MSNKTKKKKQVAQKKRKRLVNAALIIILALVLLIAFVALLAPSKVRANNEQQDVVTTQLSNKDAGYKFLEENKKKEGINVTPSGLQYKVIVKGEGAVPTAENTIKAHYRGTLIDGTQFDSSYDRGEPLLFSPRQVIKGWQEALTMMPVGSKWMLYIPQELGYGARNTGAIKPYSALIFEVELLEIVK